MMKQEIESYEVDTPTRRLFDQLSDAFERINLGLFGGQLPPVLIHIQRKGGFGYYSPAEFTAKGEQTRVAGISLNPNHFVRDDKATLGTLTHEMVHHWQEVAGNGGGRYHDREWGTKMESIGLVPSSTGQPGGKRTGSRVSHYIVEGGPFDLLADQIIAAGFRIDWASLDQGARRSPEKNKVKYTCPQCKANIWGKPGIVAMCQPCESLFVTESDAPATPAETTGEPETDGQDYDHWLKKQLTALAIHPSAWQGTDAQRAKVALEQIQKFRKCSEEILWLPMAEAAYVSLKSGQERPPRQQ